MSILSEVATNLVRSSQGYWVSRTVSDVSYPKDASECFAAIEEDSFWFNHRNDVLTSLVAAYSPQGPVFDVGGGNGYVSSALESAGHATVLVEPGPQGVEVAMQRGLKSVACSTLENAGFKERSIPAFGLFDVLEHIEDDLGFLKTLHSLLVKGGRLYLTVPAYNCLWSIDDDDAGHYRRYTIGRLRKQLVSAGFEIEFTSYLFSFLPLPILAFRSIPSRLGYRRSTSADVASREHSQRMGWTDKILNWILDQELKRIQRKRPIPAGSSCIAVARRCDSAIQRERASFSEAA